MWNSVLGVWLHELMMVGSGTCPVWNSTLGVYMYIAADGVEHTYLVTVIRGGAGPDLRLLTLSIIVDILSSAPARTSVPKQNVRRVKSPVSGYFQLQ